MNIQDISTQLMYTTLPIYTKNVDGTQSSGTGFIFSVIESKETTIPLLITNYHVVKNAIIGFMEIHLAENNMPSDKSIRVQFDKSVISTNKLEKLDLVAIPIASTLNDLYSKNITPFYRTVSVDMIPTDEQINELAAIEDVTFIGYPNGLYDEINKMSIVRQGITATPIWNNFKGEEVFLVDAGVFPGSSGSPVFIYNRGTYPTKDGIAVGNRLMFVGVLAQTMLTSNENKVKDYLNLGIVINSKVMSRSVMQHINNLKSRESK